MKGLTGKFLCLALSLLLVLLCAGCDTKGQQAVLTADPVIEESTYKLGDTMGDYTLTDVNGNAYRFSDILSEKKALVLNFWFINCGPCKIEFPYLDEAYRNYNEELEVLAIDCVGDSEADIAAFAADNNLSFPVVAGDTAWESAVRVQGYPTTIVVDRFGTVAMVHTGYIDSTDTFERIFEFFTADDYTATLVKNISDIQ
ncbi:MAG: redoxin domain-containing protein [Clostridia bacterium]|nr:redoxin domain-containing protein [Clostridia bacterium]